MRPAGSILSRGIAIRGEVTGQEDLQIDGEVVGNIRIPEARVLVGAEGRVKGQIDAREIVVRGELQGDLSASDRIVVGPTGRWKGDSISPRLAIEDGAKVHGNLEVSRPAPMK
ncbi:MAG: bactofilin family protein, partial [Bryobacteraceae bacterium]